MTKQLSETSKVYLAHKIEIRPTKEQEDFLLRSCGIARKVYNELLGRFSVTKDWSKKSALSYLNHTLKPTYPFMSEVSSRTSRNVIDDLDNAYRRFFKTRKGFPKFKKKKDGQGTFSIREKEKFSIDGRLLRIEKLKTKIKTREKLRFDGIPKECIISQKAGKWFASIVVEVDTVPCNADHTTRKPSVGVDLGIKELAVLSDATVFKANQPLKKMLKKLKRLQLKLSRQEKGSNRRKITLKRVQKLHYYVTCKRKTVLHELTDYLTKHYDRIAIEDLDVSGMMKNRKLSRAIGDCSFGGFRRQLEYKSYFRGCLITKVDRFFPSTKMCSGCGQLHDMPLSKREMNCDCGVAIDRDLNAAINIERYVPIGSGGTKICTQ